MSQADLRDDLRRAVESAYLREVSIETIESELERQADRVEDIAGPRRRA